MSNFISKCRRRKEKAIKGYDYLDLWNMDLYLLDLISRMLKELSAETISCPAGMTLDEWKEYLNKMSSEFAVIRKKTEFGIAPETILDDFNDLMKKFTEHFFDLWD